MKVPFIISIAMPGSKRMEREGGGERRQREGRMGREKVSHVVQLTVIFGSDSDESLRGENINFDHLCTHTKNYIYNVYQGLFQGQTQGEMPPWPP